MTSKIDRQSWTDISELKISQCAYCKHKGFGKFCDAFDEIPRNILENKVDHRKPIEGDRGIQFEPNVGADLSDFGRLFE